MPYLRRKEPSFGHRRCSAAVRPGQQHPSSLCCCLALGIATCAALPVAASAGGRVKFGSCTRAVALVRQWGQKGAGDDEGDSDAETSPAAAAAKQGLWRAAEVPDPTKDPKRCGLTKQGRLCDPDSILSAVGRAQAANVLFAIRQHTSKRCQDGQARGYQVGVVLIQRMHPDDWVGAVGSTEYTARRFAQMVGDHWGIGYPGCGNGVVLLISIDDRVAFISTNSREETLSDQKAVTIVDNMRPLLRAQRFDEAVLQATLQIHDVLLGKKIPGMEQESPMTMKVAMILLIGGLLRPGLLVMVLCGVCTTVLLPLAFCLDVCTAVYRRCLQRSCCRRRLRRADTAEVAAAEQIARRVRQELDRNGLDQTICPICLQPFTVVDSVGSTSADSRAIGGATQSHDSAASRSGHESAAATAVLECGHRFHRSCIDPWVLEHSSCPLCRADVPMLIAPDDELRPQEYQRRLRLYMSRLQLRHQELLVSSYSGGTGSYYALLSPYRSRRWP